LPRFIEQSGIAIEQLEYLITGNVVYLIFLATKKTHNRYPMTPKFYLLVVLTLFCSIAGRAQTATTDEFVNAGITDEMTTNPEQNKMWRTGQARYSAKPRSMWEIGLHGGTGFIAGDVEAPFPAGLEFGLHLRKAVNYTLSIRLDASYHVSKGYDARSFNFLATERVYQQRIGELPNLAAYTDVNSNDDNIHRNYKTSVLAFSLEGILNIGNILFHSPSNNWNVYGVIGGGLYIPTVNLDLLDGDQPYNFSSVSSGIDLNTASGRKDSRKNLKDLLDGDYETEGAVQTDVMSLGDKKTLIPHINVGLGLSRKISKRVNVSLEHRLTLSDNDLLDGFEYRSAQDETNNNDIIHNTTVRVGFNIGKFDRRVEPLYWVNPLDGPLNDIAELKQRPKFDLTDTDGDGVIDMTDQEINTPAGCPVDTRGITLDSDGDGVVDCKDQEPYSPPGYEVDRNGVAIITNPPLREDEVVDLINQRTAGLAASLDWFLPMIHFDSDRYYVKPEFYGALHHVASVLKAHPDLKVVVTGYTDARDTDQYNNVLSYNRAQETINYLVSNYNLPRARFVLNFGGENTPLASDGKSGSESELRNYMNRRVEFRVATATDKDMNRPEGPEAGKNTPGRPGTRYSGNYNSGY